MIPCQTSVPSVTSAAQIQMSATRALSGYLPVSTTYLTDEPVRVHEDPADRAKSTAENHVAVYREVGEQIVGRHRNEDRKREQLDWRAKGADATIRAALPGENNLDPDAFKAIVELAFPRADYPRERRQAERSGRVEWGGGVVFVRVGE